MFKDRIDAGEKLALKLLKYADKNPIVLGIPRGGVLVGSIIAKKLQCDFDIIVTRKLPIPYDPEAGFGAVTADGPVILNEEILHRINLSESQIEKIAEDVRKEVKRRILKYRGNRPSPDLQNKTVIVVDDGLATGYTMLAALKYLRTKDNFNKLIVAIPTAHEEALRIVEKLADEVIFIYKSSAPIFAVASFYEKFDEISDDEIIEYLKK